MIVYKFGGASVKDADGVKNLKSIVNACEENLVVVVSAMGKMTNALEKVVDAFFAGESTTDLKSEIFDFHKNIISGLFDDDYLPEHFMMLWSHFENELAKVPSLDFDFDYDRLVSFGELFSTSIVSDYLNAQGTKNYWMDARQILRTSNNFREAKILWDTSMDIARKHFTFSDTGRYVTQGFIGSTLNNQTTTLGREGSDFTAATLAYLLDAVSVTIWKDVPGVLNADPRWFKDAELIPEISYKEATELTFFGAQIIHPKTLKPLQNKQIPMFVKSFYEPSLPGTKVFDEALFFDLPIYIRKENQALITIYPSDFSFIVEDNIRDVFDIFTRYRVKVNLMQNSALSFSVCINYDKRRFDDMMHELKEEFKVVYNMDVELLTIRNFASSKAIDMTVNRKIYVEQKTRNTASYVLA
ncbi:aspartate kinase [Saccharicrinis sp. FJH54]|uniref:aspartate kinase n=1 Tax=Saccharicrinis sp. FJH54 TaxID=3344665 RepID=UPI0035D46EB8